MMEIEQLMENDGMDMIQRGLDKMLGNDKNADDS